MTAISRTVASADHALVVFTPDTAAFPEVMAAVGATILPASAATEVCVRAPGALIAPLAVTVATTINPFVPGPSKGALVLIGCRKLSLGRSLGLIVLR